MSIEMRAERNRRNFTDEANRYDAKRERLVLCARQLAEQSDANRVSVTDITSEMGITRGLFYYYFAGKEELNNAIVESYVSELINSIEDACAQCDNREDSMFALVKCVYNALYFEDGSRRPVWHVLREIDKMDTARRLAANEITDFIITHGMLVKYGKPSVENLIVHAHFVASGILGECGLRPDIPIEAVCDAACASLRYRKRRA